MGNDDDKLPLESVQPSKRTKFDNLEDERKLLESELKPAMVRFCNFAAVEELSRTQAAIRAGYSEASAGTRAHQLSKNIKVVRLIEVLRELDALKNGLPLEWKRAVLVGVAESDTSRGAEKTGAVKLLAELDGDLIPEVNRGMTISVNMPHLAPPQGQTIEGSSDNRLEQNDAPELVPIRGGHDQD